MDRLQSGAHADLLYWRRYPQFSNCLRTPSVQEEMACMADPRILSWWTETDLRTDSLHQSDAPLELVWCS